MRSDGVSSEQLLEGIEELRRNALLMHFAGIREALKRLVPHYERPEDKRGDVSSVGMGLLG